MTITPKTTTTFPNADKSVKISIAPNSSYVVLNPSSDQAYIVDQIADTQHVAAGELPVFDGWLVGFLPCKIRAIRASRIFIDMRLGLTRRIRKSSIGAPVCKIVNGYATLTFREPSGGVRFGLCDSDLKRFG